MALPHEVHESFRRPLPPSAERREERDAEGGIGVLQLLVELLLGLLRETRHRAGGVVGEKHRDIARGRHA